MVYNLKLEERVDDVVNGWPIAGVKKRMFGGVAYMVQGNLAFGILGNELIIRAPEDLTAYYKQKPGVHNFTFGRGHMKKIFMAGEDNLEEPMFSELLELGRDFALSLPPK